MNRAEQIVFSMDLKYMFYVQSLPATGKPDIVVENPSSIKPAQILFHFYLGKAGAEWIKKEEILAVGDMQNGTVKVKGWGGKFKILNEELFNKYVKEGIIELTN